MPPRLLQAITSLQFTRRKKRDPFRAGWSQMYKSTTEVLRLPIDIHMHDSPNSPNQSTHTKLVTITNPWCARFLVAVTLLSIKLQEEFAAGFEQCPKRQQSALVDPFSTAVPI